MSSIRWTDEAVEDLAAIRDYIARDSPHYARLVVERLIDRVEGIADFPRAGRVVPELAREELREVIQGSYRIVYRLHEDVVEVLTIFRSSRLLPLEPDDVDST